AVGKDDLARARQSDAVDEAGMVPFVREDDVLGLGQSGEHGEVGQVARREQQSPLGALELRKAALDRGKDRPIAAEQPRAGAAAPLARGPADEPVDHARVGRQIEVVVGREIGARGWPQRSKETALAQAVEPGTDAEVERVTPRHWPWPARPPAAACRGAPGAARRGWARDWEWSRGGRPGTPNWRRPGNRGPAPRRSATNGPRSASQTTPASESARWQWSERARSDPRAAGRPTACR